MVRIGAFIAGLVVLGAACAAHADPCLGPTPAKGAVVVGTVLHVVDGGRLCLASGPTPDSWTEVSLVADPSSPVALIPAVDRDGLMRSAFAKRISCTVTAVAGGAAQARCVADPSPSTERASNEAIQVAAWMGAPQH